MSTPPGDSTSAALQRYYEGCYAERSLASDQARVNRLSFLFPPDLHGKRILDVGCGPGVQYLDRMAGNEVHGIDISGDALALAASHGFITHQVDAARDPLPFEAGTFDFVVCTDLFEHLFAPLELLQEMHRVLRDDGLLLASVPNHFMYWMILRLARGKGLVLPYHPYEDWDYIHVRYFTPRSFERFLAAGGFAVRRRYYDAFTSFHWFFPRPLRRPLARRFPHLFSFHFLVEAAKRA